jgi:3-oxoadipate enol-lactonase/4-carboxymuconolactone decarboxylase
MSPVELHHVVDGPDDAPVLLLAGSLGTRLELWDPLIPQLARAFRVVRFDHRGHGGSPAPTGPYAMADLGTDVMALVEHLRIERASFCGLSLGGMVGLWLAIHAPNRIDRLALLCTSAFLPTPEMWRTRAAVVRAQGTTAVASTVAGRWFTPAFGVREPGRLAGMIAALSQSDPEGYASCCEAIASWDERDGLGAIRAPTLVVAGSDDHVTPPSHGYAIGAGIPGARVIVVDRVAHLAVLERPNVIARLLLDHLAGRSPPDSFDDDERARQGEDIRRAVLGDAHVDRAIANTTAFTAPFQDFVNRCPWGDIWARPGLSRAERSMITLTVLAAMQHEEELAMHVVAAHRNGLTPQQIGEILLHVGVYAGVPVANRAFAVAERALRQIGAIG